MELNTQKSKFQNFFSALIQRSHTFINRHALYGSGSERFDKERQFCTEEQSSICKFLRTSLNIRHALRGMMQPILIPVGYCGYRFMHKMAGKTSARFKDNLKLMKPDINSNTCSIALYGKVQDLSSVKHTVCNLKANSDDCLIRFSNERTSYSKTIPQNCYKCNFELACDVSIKDVLKEICTVDFNKCANTGVTIDYMCIKEFRPYVQCYLRNSLDIFDYFEENIENRTANLHKNSLIVIFTNLQKCIDRLQFTQKHGQICYKGDDILNSSQKGTNGDIATCIPAVDVNSDIATCIPVTNANGGFATCIPGPDTNSDIATCILITEANSGVAACLPMTDQNIGIATCIPITEANSDIATCIPITEANSGIATCIQRTEAHTDIATCIPATEANSGIATCIPRTEAHTDIATCIPATEANSDIATCFPRTEAHTDIATCIPATEANSGIATCIPRTEAHTDIATCIPATEANSGIATCIPRTEAHTDIATCIPATEANSGIATCSPVTDPTNGITTSVTDANSTAFFIPSQIAPTKTETNMNFSDTSDTHNKQCMNDDTELEISDIETGNIVQETRFLNSVSSKSLELETGRIVLGKRFHFIKSSVTNANSTVFFIQSNGKNSQIAPTRTETNMLNSVSSEILELGTGRIVLDDTELDSESFNAYNKGTEENVQDQGLLIISDNSENSNMETESFEQTHLNYDSYEVDTRTGMHEKTKLHDGLLVSSSNEYVQSVVEQYFTSFRETRTNYDHEFGSKKEKGWYSDFKQEILLYPVYKPSLESSFHCLLNGETGISTRIMCYEFHRLNSFSDFSNEWSPSRIKLAGNGWYSTGNGREAKCFSCGVYYNRWNHDSDPVQIHKELSPYCSMLNGLDGDNVPILRENGTEETAISGYAADRNGEQQSPEYVPEITGNQKQILGDQKKTEIENSSIPSVDQLSLSNDFQNLGLHAPPTGGHCYQYNNPKTNYGTSLNGLSSMNSEVSASHSAQNVGVGQIYNGSISCGQDDACTEYVNDAVANKVNKMNKSEQIHTHQGTDKENQADRGHQFIGKPLLWANNENHLPKRGENREIFKETPIYTLPSVEMISPKYPRYGNLSIRISSFRGWPSYLNQSERDLAVAGFFYKGYSDEVTCYQCGMTLANWQENDDGFVEHAKWKPSCYFIRQYKGDEFVRLVQAAQNQIEIQPSLIENGHAERPVLPHKTPAKRNSRSATRDTLLAMGFSEKEVDVAIDSIYAPSDDIELNLNEILEVLCGRQTTFSESERDVSSSSLPTSPTTNTSINASSIESSFLSGDGPISSFVPSFQQENRTQVTQNHLDITAEQLDQKSDTSRSRTETEADNRKSIECKICLDEEVGMIFTPCGHICACVTCSRNLTRCPVCRKHIVKKIRGYLS